jgi:transketolase
MKQLLRDLELRAHEIRLHVLDMVYNAQSGHIGGSFSEAEIVAALYFHILKVRPEEPKWPERDRFILSKGHACPAVYAALAMRGFFPTETLQTLRQFQSLLQGHPVIKTPGIDMTTGSLGIGFAIAVGMAIDSKLIGKKGFNVYTLLGDGEINEGVVWEAAQTANKYHLDNIVAIVDRNRGQNDGFSDDIMPVEPIDKKFKAFGWHVIKIDGHNMHEIVDSLERARDYRGQPVCIVAYTTKGKGVSFMENDRQWHGKPPSDEQYAAAREELLKGVPV